MSHKLILATYANYLYINFCRIVNLKSAHVIQCSQAITFKTGSGWENKVSFGVALEWCP